eukprot:TsM_000427200 transcript=TsM_000427200 gene=TsM_000427200
MQKCMFQVKYHLLRMRYHLMGLNMYLAFVIVSCTLRFEMDCSFSTFVTLLLVINLEAEEWLLGGLRLLAWECLHYYAGVAL